MVKAAHTEEIRHENPVGRVEHAARVEEIGLGRAIDAETGAQETAIQFTGKGMPLIIRLTDEQVDFLIRGLKEIRNAPLDKAKIDEFVSNAAGTKKPSLKLPPSTLAQIEGMKAEVNIARRIISMMKEIVNNPPRGIPTAEMQQGKELLADAERELASREKLLSLIQQVRDL